MTSSLRLRAGRLFGSPRPPAAGARRILTGGLVSLLFLVGAGRAETRHGTYETYLLLHKVGEETFSLTGGPATGGRLEIVSSVSDRGSVRASTTRYDFGRDFAPERLESRRTSPTSQAVILTEVSDGRARVQEGEARREEAASASDFPTLAAMPAALQSALMRYWLSHGRPAALGGLRASEEARPLEIRAEGIDPVRLGRRVVRLRRYTIANLIFGREVLWATADGEVAALMTFAGGLPQEEILAAYVPAFQHLVAAGVRQEMRDLAALGRQVSPEAEGAFAIVGARLIDGRGGATVADSAVLVRAGRIAAVGPAESVRIPAGTRTIDGRGRTLIPGLFDMHFHYSGVEFGPALLAAGVTTVRDCGGEFPFLIALRKASKAGGLVPRLMLAGLIDSGGPLAFGAVDVETPQAGRSAADRYADAGFNQIKIYTQVKPDVLRAAAEEAHRRGLTVTGHVPAAIDAFEGVADGMDQINHLQFVSAAMREPGASGPLDLSSPRALGLIQLLSSKAIVVDPTIGWGEMASHPRSVNPAEFEPGLRAAPFTLKAKYEALGGQGDPEAWRRRVEDNLRLIAALHTAGVPLVAGTDTGLPGYGLDRELELYVRAGLSPAAALHTATLGAARALRLERVAGSIEAGKRADLVLLAGDPLEDIGNLRRVVKVVRDGRLYDSVALGRSVGFTRPDPDLAAR